LKQFKTLVALVLALMLTMSVVGAAFASEVDISAKTDNKLTLNNPTVGHTYKLYQVFTGSYATIDGNDVLANIEWGSSITEAGKTALGGAAEYAETVSDARAFAAAVDQYLTAPVANATTTVTNGVANAIEFENLHDGYYIIKDETADDDLGGVDRDVVVVQVVKNITITAKSGTPTLDKKTKDKNDTTQTVAIYDDNGKSSDYDINDHVPFEIAVTLPQNFDLYKTANGGTGYKMIVEDTFGGGLKMIDGDSLTVKYGATLAAAKEATALTSGYTFAKADDNKSFTVTIADATAISGTAANGVFFIEYTATLTSDGVVYGGNGNPNSAVLKYQRDPADSSNGTPGQTPPSITVTFTYKFDANKVNQDGDPLAGAEFTLSKKVGDNWTALTLVTVNDTTFDLSGLDDGLYKLEETKAPAGYNKLAAPIYFKVEATHVNGALTNLTCVETNEAGVTKTGNDVASFDIELDDGTIETDIENNQGTELPSTGGIGTTIFYVAGIVLVLGAAAIIIARRKAEQE
jgi:LPXTG-motif cell wall-anchored protein